MALVLKDRVLESSTSTGTGSFTLTGAQTGYQSFSAIGNGNTTYYTIQGKNSDGTLTGEWEVGVGTWSTGNTLSRDTVLSNSLGTTAKIVFSAGAKDVFCDYPASKSVNQNADNKVLIPYTSGVTNVGSLNVGDATSHTDSGVIAAFTASEPLYLYTSLQNTSTANTSYASYAVNDGGHTSYGELGINNSNYSYSAAGFPNNTFSAPLATFVESYGGPLAIGTWDSQKISFIVNGSVNTTDAMTISAAGNVSTAKDITVNGANVGVGASSLNTFFGVDTPIATSGNANTFIGNAAGVGNTGDGNVGLGSGALVGASNSSIAIGYNAQNSAAAQDSVIIGTTASYSGTASQSVYIGSRAGYLLPSGYNNVFIGYQAGSTPTANITNCIAIGANALLTNASSNTTVIGNSDTYSTEIKTSVLDVLASSITLGASGGTVNLGGFGGTVNLGSGATSVTNVAGEFQLPGSTTANQNIATNQTTGNLTIGGASATGSTTLNGNVKLATKSSLPTATAGLIEYDGLAFYNSIAASTRGVMPSEQFVILNSSYTLTSQTAAQKIFNNTTNGAVTLPVGTYQFECLFSLTSLSVVSGTFGFEMVAGTAVIGSQGWTAISAKPTSFAIVATPTFFYGTSATTTLTGLNVNPNGVASIKGTIKITTAGTIIPSVSMTQAAAAVVGINSYFKISPISKTNAANITVGNWS